MNATATQPTIPTLTPEAISVAIASIPDVPPEPIASPLLSFMLANKPLVWAIAHDPRRGECGPYTNTVRETMAGMVFGELGQRGINAIDPADVDELSAGEIACMVLHRYIPDDDWLRGMLAAQSAWHEQHGGQVAIGGDR